jgi:hypothetical protein
MKLKTNLSQEDIALYAAMAVGGSYLLVNSDSLWYKFLGGLYLWHVGAHGLFED